MEVSKPSPHQDTANLQQESFERQVSINESSLVLFKSTIQTEKKSSKNQLASGVDGTNNNNNNNPFEIKVQNSMKKLEQNIIERILIIDTIKQKITFIDHYVLQDMRRNVKFEETPENDDKNKNQESSQQYAWKEKQQQLQMLQDKYELLQQQHQEQQHLIQQQLEQKFQAHLYQQIHAIRSGFETEKEMLIQKQQLQIYQFKDIASSQNSRIVELEDQVLRRNEELRAQKVAFALELEQKAGHIQSLYFNLRHQEERYVEIEKQLKFYSTINDSLRDSMCSLASKSSYSMEQSPQTVTKQQTQSQQTQSCLSQQDEVGSESDSQSEHTGQNHQQQSLPERKHKISKKPKISTSNFKLNNTQCSSLSVSPNECQEKTVNASSSTNISNYNNILIQKNAKYFANYFYLFLNNTAEAKTIIAENNPSLSKETIAKIIQDFNLQHTQKTLNRKDLMELIQYSQLSTTFNYFLTHKATNLINLSTAKNKTALLKTLDVILNLFPESPATFSNNEGHNKLLPLNLTSYPSSQPLDSSQLISQTQIL